MTALSKPLQAILIAGEKKRDEVIQGHKTTTFRMGWRDYSNGMALVGCHVLNWCVGVNIIDVQHFILKDVPLNLLKKNGYKSLESAISDLKTIYPTIDSVSKVTFVEWERN